jgi:tetratricopeptide (TPR) repeat protein
MILPHRSAARKLKAMRDARRASNPARDALLLRAIERVLMPVPKAMLGLLLALSPVTFKAQTSRTPPPPQPPTDLDGGFKYTPPGPAKSVEIGNFYLKRHNYKAAISRFKEAIQTRSDYAPAYLGLGKAYEKTGQKQKALDAYRKYLDALPSDKDAEDARDVHRAIARLRGER